MAVMNCGARTIPKRWWWRKRLAIPLAVFLLSTGGVRVWWEWHADKVLAAEIDRIRARGEPLSWKELQPEPIPDSENAALLYRQAGKNPLLQSPFSWRDDRSPRIRRLSSMLAVLSKHACFRQSHPDELAEILKIAGPELALCRRASALSKADWGVDFGLSAMDGSEKAQPSGSLRTLMQLAAVHAHDTGNDAELLACIEDIMAFGRAAGAGPGFHFFLVVWTAEAAPADILENVLPTLRVSPTPGGVSRERLSRLIERLLDDGSVTDRTVRAAVAGRCRTHDQCEWFHSQTARASPSRIRSLRTRAPIALITGPVWKLDHARALREMTHAVEAARAPMLSEALAHLRHREGWHDRPESAVFDFTRTLSRVAAAAPGFFVKVRSELLARRRLAATALAIRLYQLDHHKRPEKLGDLVPAYLPAVPIDPQSPRDRKIGYVNDDKYPLLYTCGRDFADDGSAWKVIRNGEYKGMFERRDTLFFLAGNRPHREPFWEDPLEKDPWTRRSRDLTSPTPSPAPPLQSRPAPGPAERTPPPTAAAPQSR